jgi:hypothetical protein
MYRVRNVRRFVIPVFVTLLAVNIGHRASAETSEVSSGGMSSHFRYPSMGSYSAPYGFSSTAFEGAQRGRAALVDAWGNYELNVSQAAINWQQARDLDRINDLEQAAALNTKREIWRQGREAERQAREDRDAQGQVKFAELRATLYKRAYALSAAEFNSATGEICWPVALKSPKYACERQRLEQLFRTLASNPDPQPQLAERIGGEVDRLVRAFRGEAGNLPRDEYLAAQKFLRGLKYAAG